MINTLIFLDLVSEYTRSKDYRMTMVEALVSTNRSFPRILYAVQYYIGKLINLSLHEKSRRRWDIFNEKGFKYFFILK